MKVLICPLNWGLGHATRCVPIIKKLMDDGQEVVVAADGYPLAFLQQYFPQLTFVDFPSCKIHYSAGKSQVWAMLRSLPGILKGIYSEHRKLAEIISINKIERVISDNRFGLWNRKVQSIYMTHQLMVKMPNGLKFIEPIGWRMHRWIIKHYDECWVPDIEGSENLSGDLSHQYPLLSNTRYIGLLSRFQNVESSKDIEKYDVVALVSGPEPQRTIFENALKARFENSSEKVLIVRGLPGEKSVLPCSTNITFENHMTDEALASVLVDAQKIIARSGYSTIMDLNVLQCFHKTEFIPTPGQTEQEYLYRYLSQKQNAGKK